MPPSAPLRIQLSRGASRSVVLLLALSLSTAAGCSKPEQKVRASAAEAEPSTTSESAKARELEDKAAGYQDRFQEIQESDMTAEQKAQAAGELVDEQQRTVREAEDGSATPADGEAQQ